MCCSGRERDCGWGVEDDRESEGEKGCVQGLWVGSGG